MSDTTETDAPSSPDPSTPLPPSQDQPPPSIEPSGAAGGVPLMSFDAAADHYYATIATDGTISTSGMATAGLPVPQGTTIITREQYQTIGAVTAMGGHCKMVSGVLIPEVPVTPQHPSLAQAKHSATVLIDEAAEKTRLLFLTPGSGQAMEYEATQTEAKVALAQLKEDAAAVAMAAMMGANDPDYVPRVPPPLSGADFPWLEAERQALLAMGQSFTIEQIAQVVTDTMAQWTMAGAEIKRVRRTAKMMVEGCTTPELVDAVLAGIVWPSAG